MVFYGPRVQDQWHLVWTTWWKEYTAFFPLFWPHHNAVTFLEYLTFDQEYCSRLCFNNQLMVYRPKWRLKILSREKFLYHKRKLFVD